MEGTIGEVRLFGGNFAPRNWNFCNGATINISSNTALFSILGTTYGGNGTTNFMLPNTQGRVVIGAGTSPITGTYPLGEMSGSETNIMTVNNMPSHTHSVMVSIHSGTDAENGDPTGIFYGSAASGNQFSSTTNVMMNPGVLSLNIGPSGGGPIPFNNLMAYMALPYIICMYGVFPQRS